MDWRDDRRHNLLGQSRQIVGRERWIFVRVHGRRRIGEATRMQQARSTATKGKKAKGAEERA